MREAFTHLDQLDRSGGKEEREGENYTFLTLPSHDTHSAWTD